MEAIWVWRLYDKVGNLPERNHRGGVEYSEEDAYVTACHEKALFISLYNKDLKNYATSIYHIELKKILDPNEKIWSPRLWNYEDEKRFEQFKSAFYASSPKGMRDLENFLSKTRKTYDQELKVIDSLRKLV